MAKNRMNNEQKLKLFWKITKCINKEFCKGKLVINGFILFKKEKIHGVYLGGYYWISKKAIGIYDKNPLIIQVMTLHHELVHAYQDQILKLKLSEEKLHEKRNFKIYKEFVEETNKIIKISA
mgnify:CR=1 FL=1